MKLPMFPTVTATAESSWIESKGWEPATVLPAGTLIIFGCLSRGILERSCGTDGAGRMQLHFAEPVWAEKDALILHNAEGVK